MHAHTFASKTHAALDTAYRHLRAHCRHALMAYARASGRDRCMCCNMQSLHQSSSRWKGPIQAQQQLLQKVQRIVWQCQVRPNIQQVKRQGSWTVTSHTNRDRTRDRTRLFHQGHTRPWGEALFLSFKQVRWHRAVWRITGA
jgi:hypothetical protein